MGLDMYISARKKIFCPDCGKEVACIPLKEEINDYDDLIVYWRKNRDLFNYISENIAPHGYGNEQYGSDLELSIEDLQKIKKFTHRREQNTGELRDDGLDLCIKLLKENPDIEIVYNADW